MVFIICKVSFLPPCQPASRRHDEGGNDEGQLMGSPKMTTERNAPMKRAQAMRYQRKVKPDTLSIITM